MPRTQQYREIQFSCSLPEDKLLFHRMSGVEQLSQLYRYDVDLLSEDPSVDLDAVLGTEVSVKIETAQGLRYFRGIVAQFLLDGQLGGLFRYRAVLRPWTWLLSRSADCRVFQQMSVPEIVTAVLRENGLGNVKSSLAKTYTKRDYCVQYRESNLDFVSRLLESEGIYYFFEHDSSQHTMVLADGATAHQAITGYAKIEYFAEENARREREHISDWSVQREVQTGKVTLTDYDFTKPKSDLTSVSTQARSHAQSKFEVYDYPGNYVATTQGEAFARNRLDAFHSGFQQSVGVANVRQLTTGKLFTLENFPRGDQNAEYLITSVRYQLEGDDYQNGGSSPNPYSCTFTAIPSQQTFRPSLQTPKPPVTGPQTALVVGKQGEEIWTDQYGRIKIQFHWDRLGKTDENSSCWVRVAQSWAGKKWGGLMLPRIGQEVLVDFLHGDIDQPIVVASVYNADQMPPYQLPDQATQSGWRSRSTKNGSDKTFNELTFDDKLDQEKIFLQAQRDFVCVVKNNDSLQVGFETKDPGDQKIEVYNDCSLSVEKGNRSVTVKEKNDQLEVTKGDHMINVAAGLSQIEAKKSIELKVGSSSILIEPSKITIKSAEIVLQGTSKVSATAPTIEATGNAKVAIKAPMAQVQADGNLVLKGGIVQIN